MRAKRILLVTILACAVLSARAAASQYTWYTPSGTSDLIGANTMPSNEQWVTPYPSVGANYLATSECMLNPSYSCAAGEHLLTNPGGVTSDIAAPTAGDYCNHYSTGISTMRLNQQNGNTALGDYTGFRPPTPVASYQQTTSASGGLGSGCQAYQANWGLWLNASSDPNTYCINSSECSAQHVVSFAGTNDYPWSSAFGTPGGGYGGPELTLYNTLKVQSYSSHSGPDGAGYQQGFMCPIFQDTSASGLPRYLEFCIAEWQTAAMGTGTGAYVPANCDGSYAYPYRCGGQYAKNFGCDVSTINGVTEWVDWSQDGLNSNIWSPQARYITSLQANTITAGQTGSSQTYEATITWAQLQALLGDLNSYMSSNANCHYGGQVTQYSTNPPDYRLVGIENGINALSVQWSGWLGATESLLQAWTAY